MGAFRSPPPCARVLTQEATDTKAAGHIVAIQEQYRE